MSSSGHSSMPVKSSDTDQTEDCDLSGFTQQPGVQDYPTRPPSMAYHKPQPTQMIKKVYYPKNHATLDVQRHVLPELAGLSTPAARSYWPRELPRRCPQDVVCGASCQGSTSILRRHSRAVTAPGRVPRAGAFCRGWWVPNFFNFIHCYTALI
jgi:hypothetical protein